MKNLFNKYNLILLSILLLSTLITLIVLYLKHNKVIKVDNNGSYSYDLPNLTNITLSQQNPLISNLQVNPTKINENNKQFNQFMFSLNFKIANLESALDTIDILLGETENKKKIFKTLTQKDFSSSGPNVFKYVINNNSITPLLVDFKLNYTPQIGSTVTFDFNST